jgi:prepilin-type N-terminal cleavage/methylation domain-containing protein
MRPKIKSSLKGTLKDLFFRFKGLKEGFTLLECLLSLALLGAIMASMIGIQSSSQKIMQKSEKSLFAFWALRSALEQTYYRLDALGLKDGLKSSVSYESKLYPGYKVTISKEILKDFQTSELIEVIFKLQNSDAEGSLEQVKGFLPSVSKTINDAVKLESFAQINVGVSWDFQNKNHQEKVRYLYIEEDAVQ